MGLLDIAKRSSLGRMARAVQRVVAQTVTLPAPVGGWNTRDAWPAMAPQFAITLDNWFPQADGIYLRKGYEEHCDVTDPVGTLYSYHVGADLDLLAFTEEDIIDVTTATPSVLATGFTSAFWSTVTFGRKGVFVNGVDQPQQYDGSAISAATYSGTTDDDFIGVSVFKNRLFFWKDNDQSFWYVTAVDNVTGTVAEFDLAYAFSVSGKIVSIATITFDGGNGVDDQIAIIFSSGQVVIYQGTDPGDAELWSLVGSFQLPGQPVGRRCTCQYGGDVLVMTNQGYFPLSKAITLGNLTSSISISDTINPAIAALARENPNATFWQAMVYPAGQMLMFNVPASSSSGRDGQYDQHVMNTTTGAWARFTGMDASCWVVHGSELYFAGQDDGVVWQGDIGTSDDDEQIVATGRQAFTNAGDPARVKRWNLARPIFQSEGFLPVAMALSVDFGNEPPFAAISSSTGAGSPWDTSPWDTSPWGYGATLQRNWQSISGVGHSASVSVKVSTGTQDVRWYQTQYVYEPGAYM
ncbi:MAG: hypothetical protein AB7I33_12700 [Gemmatimonadales bacterium]